MHFDALKRYLMILGLDFNVDHRLVRGLDYYTKTVFEIQPPGAKGAQSTVGGGGRYDDLIEEIGGKAIPAVGFATGFERVILNLHAQAIEIPPEEKPITFVAFLGNEAKGKALDYATQLRRNGVGAIVASGNRSLKAQMRQANALNAAHTIIIGEDEIRDGVVMVRNMSGGDQQRLSFEEAIEVLRK